MISQLIIYNEIFTVGVKAGLHPELIKFLHLLNTHPCVMNSSYDVWIFTHTKTPIDVSLGHFKWMAFPIKISNFDIMGNNFPQYITNPGYSLQNFMDIPGMKRHQTFSNSFSIAKALEYYKLYSDIIHGSIDEKNIIDINNLSDKLKRF